MNLARSSPVLGLSALLLHACWLASQPSSHAAEPEGSLAPAPLLAAPRIATAHIYCLSLRVERAVAEEFGLESTLELSDNNELFLSGPTIPYTHQSDFRMDSATFPEALQGTLVVNVPDGGDANTNGVPDFFEVSQSVSSTETQGEFILPDVDDQGSIRAVWSRNAGTKTGSCRLTLTSAGFGQLPEFTTTYDIFEYDGTLTYNVGSTNITGAIHLVQLESPENTLDGPLVLTRVPTNRFDQVDFNDGGWSNATGQAVAFFEGTVRRATTNAADYLGALSFVDFDLNTEAEDYYDWIILISDPNDANSNGIPDLSDDAGGEVPPPQLKPIRFAFEEDAWW
jgi:hypothetical protein